MASNPVSLSSRFLKAWTEYVNGSATAMTCIQAKSLLRIHGPAREIEQRVEHAENRPRQQRIVTRTMIRNIMLINARMRSRR